jgi:capsular exopolysaccharide synthesis family protein
MMALKKEIQALTSRLEKEQKRIFDQLVKTTEKEMITRKQELDHLNAEIKKQNERIVMAQLEAKELSSSLDSRIAVLEQNSQVIDKKKEYLELALGLKQIGRTDKVIVEPARMPGGPFAPSLKQYLLSGIVLALILAGCLIFLIEITDRKIHNTEVLEMVTGLPTLATIPKVSNNVKNIKLPKDPKKRKIIATRLRQEIGLQTHLKPNDPFSESYRHLRTNIQLSKTTDNQVFLLSSALSGEGKTISSLNLAISFSQLEKKTLIVDCDLRRPKLHKIFNLPNQVGLVTALVKKKPITELISPTKVPNLYLLSSGPLPPNPAELIASQRMKEVIAEFKRTFDFIIIDTAPLLAVTDASILGNLVDSLIFVSQASSTSRDEVARALQTLSQNQIKPLGTLFNNYDFSKGKKYYGYKYGYRYKYGYGYGYVPYTYNNPEDS